MSISPEEWNQISAELEVHHALFYQMWQMGRPIFDKSIETAAVSFDPIGEFVNFIFNPDFWEKLNLEERKFVICHEALHVIFNHGIRTTSAKSRELANIALDLIVNHALVDKFGFSRSSLSIGEELIWLDRVFGPEAVESGEIKKNQTFEYYYLKLKAEAQDLSKFVSLDDHSTLGGIDSEQMNGIIGKLDGILSNQEKMAIKDVIEGMTEDLKQDKQRLSRGTSSLGAWHFVDISKVKKKKKWETVIQRWSRKYMKRAEDSVEQWARRARRFATLPNDLMLPTEMDEDHWQKDKIQVWFFQDCSGSCIHLKDRFFKAAKSLPKDTFEVKMHTFDTRVFEIDNNSKGVWGGGGTSFSCIERYIQNYIKEHKQSYPAAVFCITDGMGDLVHPERPENWYWFLSYNYRYCIPQKSQVFELANFE